MLVTNIFFATTTFKKQPLVALQMQNNLATATFADDDEAIFDPRIWRGALEFVGFKGAGAASLHLLEERAAAGRARTDLPK